MGNEKNLCSQSNLVKELDFGRLDAESDRSILNYFVQTGSVEEIKEGKYLVLGRKGSGKTAIFKYLEKEEHTKDNVVSLDLKEYPYAAHKMLKENGMTDDNAHTLSWIFLIVLISIKFLDIKDKLSRKERKVLNNALKVMGKYSSLNSVFTWIKRVKKWDLKILGSGAGLEISDSMDDSLSVHMHEFIEQGINVLNSYYNSSGNPVTVLIDGIDDSWDGEESTKNFIIGSLRAVRNLYSELDRTKSMAPAVMFLRTDIWDSINFNDKNKYMQDAVKLNWSDENLVSVVEARAKYSIGKSDIGWVEIFETGAPIRNRRDSKGYILSRTMGRPRDILSFSRLALNKAQELNHPIIKNSDITDVELEYSEHIYNELENEYKLNGNWFKNFEKIVQKINKRSFSMDEWVGKSEEVDGNFEYKKVFDTLFNVSVIGVIQKGGSTGGSKHVYRYNSPRLKYDEKTTFTFHPAIVKYLGLRDR